MAKLRRMLTDIDAAYIQSLMRLIETQSRETIAAWCIVYARDHVLPLWEAAYSEDDRPAAALKTALDYLKGNVKLPEAKKRIAECRNAAKESEGTVIAQGAARTIGAVAAAIHNPAGSLSIALYGALTLAYDRAGTDAPWEVLESLAAAECTRMEEALREIAVHDEVKPAKINWNC